MKIRYRDTHDNFENTSIYFYRKELYLKNLDFTNFTSFIDLKKSILLLNVLLLYMIKD